MTFDRDVREAEVTLQNLIDDIHKRASAVENGKFRGITINVTATKTELQTSKDALSAALTAYNNAVTTWFASLP